jgi:hypothetical protein
MGPFRRKLPKRRIPLTREQQTAIEIEQIDESLEWIQLEILDIFADVETPAGSDNEPEEENLNLSQNETQAMNSNEIQISNEFLNETLNVPVLPQTNSNISTLYTNPGYLRNAQKKKMKKMKKIVKTFPRYDQKRFKQNLEEVKDLYINNGGRKRIHELFAFYHTQTEDSDDISDSDIDLTSDSEIDDGNDENDDDQNQRGNAFAIEI